MGEAACICCASGSGVAQEEVWGLLHPDAGAGFEVRIQGSEGVERWMEVGEDRWAGGLCWEWGRCGIVS